MCNKKKNNFIIFDQSLSSIDGHSYIYIKNIFLESKKHFDSVKLFTNNNFLFLKKNFLHKYIDGSTNFIPITFLKNTFFNLFPKLKKNNKKKKNLRGIVNKFISFDYFLNFLFLIKKLNKNENNYIFIQYYDEGIFWLLKLCKFFNINIQHLNFLIIIRYELNYFNVNNFKSNFLKLINSTYFKKRLKFFTDNLYLSKRNNNILKKKIFFTLPLVIKDQKILKKKIRKKNFLISCLGPMRLDKGAEFISNILEKYDLDKNNITINIQVNKDHPFSEKYFSKIKYCNKSQIKFLKGPISEKDFYFEILNSDALFCPYEKEKYKLSTSNIFLESIFLNTPTIFTNGTWASNFIDAYKKRNIFLGYSLNKSLNDFHNSINFIKKNKKKIFKDLKKFKREWKIQNNYNTYFKILMR